MTKLRNWTDQELLEFRTFNEVNLEKANIRKKLYLAERELADAVKDKRNVDVLRYKRDMISNELIEKNAKVSFINDKIKFLRDPQLGVIIANRNMPNMHLEKTSLIRAGKIIEQIDKLRDEKYELQPLDTLLWYPINFNNFKEWDDYTYSLLTTQTLS